MFLNEIQIILFDSTPLYHAIKTDNIEMVKILLSNQKIDINAVNISNVYLNMISFQFFFNNV